MRASVESGIDNYGWQGALMDIAGTPDRVEAIGRVNLYDFMLFLSYQKAKAKFEESYGKGS